MADQDEPACGIDQSLRPERAETLSTPACDWLVHLAETANDAAFSFSLWPERLCDHISPSAETLVGYTARAHYHDPRLPLTYVHPDDRPTLESPFESPKEYPDRLPIRWIHENGSAV